MRRIESGQATHGILVRKTGCDATRRENVGQTKRLKLELEHLSGEASWFISHEHAMEDEGRTFASVTDFAESAWREERLSALIDALGREREAVIHRISAASCYEKAGDDTRAANLYRAALAGPVVDSTRGEVQDMLFRCLSRLTSAEPSRQHRAWKGAVSA